MTAGPDHNEVRAAYDTVASSYAELIPGLSAEAILDVAAIDSFIARVLENGGGPVLDVGAGPGRITNYLVSRGVDASGIDLSPGMVEVARDSYPELRFAVGSLGRLEFADASLAGVVAWYSIIHTPPEELPGVFMDFHRVLRPGGVLLIGMHVGEGPVRVTRSYGHDVEIDLQLFDPNEIATVLRLAHFTIAAQVVREPQAPERRPQAFVLAAKSN
ncbi:MAG TPA: class I SAM-dependent methyltransferase [Galbitalea sp.]|jgi:SAM-dependent methyltransferase|nr:class I SAM-dependent methyltransferase [Galbitalea sp.]